MVFIFGDGNSKTREKTVPFWGGGSATEPPPPQWAKASLFMRFLNYTHNDVPQSVGLLWTNDQLVAETST